MNNLNEVKRLQQLAGINEMKINDPSLLTPEVIFILNKLTENYGEGDSGFELDEPSEESYEFDEEYSDINKKEWGILISKLNGKTVVTNKLGIVSNFRCPGAPADAFYSKIECYNNVLSIFSPYMGNDGDSFCGWFNIKGDYFADTQHFDEDGNLI